MSAFVLTAQKLRTILIDNMGWEEIDLSSFKELARQLPDVTLDKFIQQELRESQSHLDDMEEICQVSGRDVDGLEFQKGWHACLEHICRHLTREGGK